MATLYVTEQGARLEREYRRILVTLHDQVHMAVPVARLGEVVLVGRVGATTPALLMLLDAGVPLSLVSSTGRLRGRLTPPRRKNLALRHAQYHRACDGDFCLGLAQRIVAGKLGNTLTMARRIVRARPEMRDVSLARLEEALARAPGARDLAQLRGLEGMGARAYFAVFRRGLRPEFRFDRRTRRPPKDPANLLLSLGYTLLTQNLMTACEVVGLDPYDGFYHADKYGRPALALDLVEEFRVPVVDSVVRTVINRGVLRLQDFESSHPGGLRLGKRGLRRFLRAYAHRLDTAVQHERGRRPISYQKLFEVQARRLAKVITGELDNYPPFRIR